MAALHSKILYSPAGGPNSFNFMQFLGKFGKIVCWRPLEGWRPQLGEILDPPLDTLENCMIILIRTWFRFAKGVDLTIWFGVCFRAWMNEEPPGSAVERLSRRIERVTGLDSQLRAKLSSSEHLQVSRSTVFWVKEDGGGLGTKPVSILYPLSLFLHCSCSFWQKRCQRRMQTPPSPLGRSS